MNNKFKFLTIAFTLLFSSAYTDYAEYNPWYPETEESAVEYDYGVNDSYRYVSVGVGPVVFIPNLGIGYRERNCQLGWDTGLSFSTIGYAHQLSAHIVGHYYLNPYQQNSLYLGLGLLGSGVIENKGHGFGTLSTDFVIGKEFERTDCSRQFLEMHVGIPTLAVNFKGSASMCYLPMMYIKYGMSF